MALPDFTQLRLGAMNEADVRETIVRPLISALGYSNGMEAYVRSERTLRYDGAGSVRVDVLERVGNGTVCVYDIKTGERGLSARRMAEIADNVHSVFRDTRRIIVIETRPR